MSEEFHAMRSNSRKSIPTHRLRCSRRAAGVAVMQAADHRHAGDRAKLRRRDFALLGSTSDFVNDYEYDRLGRTTVIKQHGVSGGNPVADKRVNLGYDAAGNPSWTMSHETE